MKLAKAAPPGDCEACAGTGSEWKKARSGRTDRRYTHPIGPCSECHGTGYKLAEGWVLCDEPFRHYKVCNPKTGKVTWNGAAKQRIISVTDVLDGGQDRLTQWAIGNTLVAAEHAAVTWFDGVAPALATSTVDFAGLAQLTGLMPDSIRDDKAAIGTASHHYLAARLAGRPAPAGSDVIPYGVRCAIDEYLADADVSPVADARGLRVERAVGDFVRAVAGTYDAQLKVRREVQRSPVGVHRVDLKTSNTIQPKHFAQVCEYERDAQLNGEEPSDYCTVLHATPLGTYKPHSIPVGGTDYLLALDVFDHYLALRRKEPQLGKLLRSTDQD